MGKDNANVYQSLLGLSEAELDGLRKLGVI